MNQERLAELVERPEVQRKLLRGYKGGYSLGLTLNPANSEQIAIRVRIEDQEAPHLPDEIELEGERIPVIVNTGFRVPAPLPLVVPHS